MHNVASGRPVRFFAILMGGWVILRVASTVISGNMETASPLQLEPVAAAELITPALKNRVAYAAPTGLLLTRSAMNAASFAEDKVPARATLATSLEYLPQKGENSSALSARPPEDAAPTAPSLQPPTALAAPSFTSQQGDRWRASAWALWREGSGNAQDLVTGGRLGGSQAGLRLDYDLTPASVSRAAVYGRVSSALNRPASPEGAVGLAWQPARSVPLTIAAERRIALGNGARDANALFAVGGFGPRPVLGKVEAEAYAQAGMVGFSRRDLFADGKLSLLAPLSRTPMRTGMSISGGAQPQLERLDIGPEVQLRLPLPRAASRLSIEWRERVAGQASPSSGFAVTLGTDF